MVRLVRNAWLLYFVLAVYFPCTLFAKEGINSSSSGKSSGSTSRDMPPPPIPEPEPSPRSRTVSKPATKAEKPTIKKGETLEGKVVGVTDGDTLTLLADKTQYKIRLLGIDAPESGQPFGTEAKKALSEKVFGKEVKVTSNGPDKYGRTLGIVKIDKRNINSEMVREGYAWHYKYFTESKVLATAEEEARKGKAGLWADSNPTAPWEWRHPSKASSGDSFDDAPAPKSASTTPPKTEPKNESKQEYWITTSSGIRHNSSCRYYHNSKGRSCGPNEGRACKICGG